MRRELTLIALVWVSAAWACGPVLPNLRAIVDEYRSARKARRCATR